ncbi:MAG: formylglycine-generating enzyme family protein [Cyanophyceae cyanobacterium]
MGCSHYKYLPKEEPEGKLTEVGKFPANSWGLHDMHGNVWEWCADTWQASYKKLPKNGSPWIDVNDQSGLHPLRGGSWKDKARVCRSASRAYQPVSIKNSLESFGFRIMCEEVPSS